MSQTFESASVFIPCIGRRPVDVRRESLTPVDFFSAVLLRFRWLWACAALAAATCAVLQLPNIRFEDDPERMLRSRDARLEKTEELLASFPADDRAALILLEGDDVGSQANIEKVRILVAELNDMEDVSHVDSIFSLRGRQKTGRYWRPLMPGPEADAETFAAAKEELLTHPLGVGKLIDADATALVLVAWLNVESTELAVLRPILSDIRDQLGEWTTTAPGVDWSITGIPSIRVEIIDAVQRDQILFSIAGVALGIIMGWLMFRRLGAVILVNSGPVAGLLWTLGIVAGAGIPVNVLTSVTPALVLVIGFTDAVHLVLEIRRELEAGAERSVAVRNAWRETVLPCLLTSVTTAIGFGSLLTANMHVIANFGMVCACGTLLSFVAVMVVVPVLASFCPVHWIARERLPASSERTSRFWGGLCDFVVHRRRSVLGVGAVVFVVLAFAATKLESDYAINDSIPGNSETRSVISRFRDDFGGVMFAFVVVNYPEESDVYDPRLYDVLREVHRAVDRTKYVRMPTSALSLVESLPGQGSFEERIDGLDDVPDDVLARFVDWDEDARVALVSARMPDVGARAVQPDLYELEQELARIEASHPDFGIQLAGPSVVAVHNLRVMIDDLKKSLLTAGVVIFFVMTIALRSVYFGLISVAPNAFPLLCTAGGLALVGRPLEISSVIVFTICLGLAVDDTIHFLVRYRRRRAAGETPSQAAHHALETVGTALLITTVVLAAGFGVVAASEVPLFKIFAALTCSALVAALLGDLVLLPALLAATDRAKEEPSDQRDSENASQNIEPDRSQ